MVSSLNCVVFAWGVLTSAFVLSPAQQQQRLSVRLRASLEEYVDSTVSISYAKKYTKAELGERLLLGEQEEVNGFEVRVLFPGTPKIEELKAANVGLEFEETEHGVVAAVPAGPGIDSSLRVPFLGLEVFDELEKVNRHVKLEAQVGREDRLVAVEMARGFDASTKVVEFARQLRRWNMETDPHRGEVFESDVSFQVSLGRDALKILRPDVAWVQRDRLDTLRTVGSYLEKSKGYPLVPDFVIQVRSPTMTKAQIQQKMKDWRAARVAVAWLFDPLDNSVEVFRHREAFTTSLTDRPATIPEDPDILPGFHVDLDPLWRERPWEDAFKNLRV